MKKFIILSALAITVLTSCSKKDDPKPAKDKPMTQAEIQALYRTKVVS